MLGRPKTNVGSENVADTILASVPTPVSLVKVENTEPDVEFHCVIEGTATGWALTIESNLEEHQPFIKDFRRIVPLDEYGQTIKELGFYGLEDVKVSAAKHLQRYRNSYERCKEKYIITEKDAEKLLK